MVATATDVLAFGSNHNGQLGLGEYGPASSRIPVAIPGLHNMMIVSIVCGASHTLCVSAQSQVSTGAMLCTLLDTRFLG